MENINFCIIPLIAVRAMPDERAELVSQILFGEFYEVLETIDRWASVKLLNDGYQGWIDRKLVNPITEAECEKLIDSGNTSVVQPYLSIQRDNSFMLIPGGSIVYGQNSEHQFTIGTKVFKLVKNEELIKLSGENAIKLALNYLNAPYLWGGKTIFGIDCSGLTQVVYSMMQFQLPRDASQQAGLGETIQFIDEAKPGDLAFFDNAEGKITHVGIVMENKKIIHASSSVRIDSLDHQGIYNHETGKYSHKLRVVKRII